MGYKGIILGAQLIKQDVTFDFYSLMRHNELECLQHSLKMLNI